MARLTKFITQHSVAQLAYLAGLVDGEGCFYVGKVKQGRYGNGWQFHTCLTICSCDEIIIVWLENTFGGVRESRYRWTSQKTNYRPVFNWRAQGPMLDYLCPLIYPYLIIKRKQCEVMLQIRATYANIGSKRLPEAIANKRIELIAEMRTLNSRFADRRVNHNTCPLSPSV